MKMKELNEKSNENLYKDMENSFSKDICDCLKVLIENEEKNGQNSGYILILQSGEKAAIKINVNFKMESKLAAIKQLQIAKEEMVKFIKKDFENFIRNENK